MRSSVKLASVLLSPAVLLLAGCNLFSGSSTTAPAPITTMSPWTWEGGSTTVGSINGQLPVYGTQGTPAATNNPGGRSGAAKWTDPSGNLWLFGGTGPAAQDQTGLYSDLWEYNTTTGQWTWVNGSNTINAGSTLNGSYGTLGVAAATNAPPARTSPLTWVDSSGNLWMFGGNAVTTFNVAVTVETFTYVNGTKTPSTPVTTTPGTPVTSTLTTPLNDLWKYSPSTGLWTWEGGTNITAGSFPPNASYGKVGVAASTNYPGPRNGAVSWTDASGNFWLFGGTSAQAGSVAFLSIPSSTTCYTGTQTVTYYTELNSNGELSDLWEYSPTTGLWTWVAGSSSYANDTATVTPPATIESATNNAVGSYGTQGVASASNEPGARYSGTTWTDTAGNLWLFGGYGNIVDPDTTCVNTNTSTTTCSNPPVTTVTTTCTLPATAVPSLLNDLWEFSPTTKQWTWVSGSNGVLNPAGVYGTQGTAAAGNVPGGRTNATPFTDTAGNLWLFGGQDLTAAGRNDLWEFNQSTGLWTWVSGTSTPDAVGDYGVLGTAADTNDVGARTQATGWTDKSGSFWLYGGTGYDSKDNTGELNDLWFFKP